MRYNIEVLNEGLFDKTVFGLSTKNKVSLSKGDFAYTKSFINHAIYMLLVYSVDIKVKANEEKKTVGVLSEKDKKELLDTKVYKPYFSKSDFTKGYNYMQAKNAVKSTSIAELKVRDLLSQNGWTVEIVNDDSKSTSIVSQAKKEFNSIMKSKYEHLSKGLSNNTDKEELSKFNNGLSDRYTLFNWNLHDYTNNAREFASSNGISKVDNDISALIKDTNKKLPKGYTITNGSGDWDSDFIELTRSGSIKESYIPDFI